MTQKPGRIVYTLWWLSIFLLLILRWILSPLRALFGSSEKGREVTIAGLQWWFKWEWRFSTGRELTKLVKLKLADQIDKNVTIHVSNSPRADAIEDGNFHLHIWSNPTGTRFKNVPREMWGLEVSNLDEALAPSGSGFAICDPCGWEAAELVGENNLFVHHNLIKHGTDAELALLKRMLQDAVEVIKLPADKRQERATRAIAERRVVSRKCLVERFTDPRFPEVVRDCRKAIEAGVRGIEQTQSSLFSAGRAEIELKRELDEAEALEQRRLQKVQGDFDKLMKEIKGVQSIAWEGNRFVILTDVLYCADPRTGTRHLIGRFRIEIYPNGDHGGVLWHNLTHKIDGWEPEMNAPHILASGRPCLGNTQELFPKLLGADQYAQLATLAVRFPQSVNINDKAGKFIDKWPKA